MPRYKVLYVEDNPANLKLVQHIIMRLGDIEFIEAVTPEDGLQKALDNDLDIILLDINLPGMNGFDLLRIMREKGAIGRAKVLALSANAMPADIKRGWSAGFDDYLTKPLDIFRFQQIIGDLLQGETQ